MIISLEKEQTLRKAIPEVGPFLDAKNLREVQILLNFAIVDALDSDYNSTPKSRELQKLYDEIYEQN